MIAQLSLRERRLVAIAILVALVALLLYGVIMPIANGFTDRADARAALAATYAGDERAVVQIASARRAAEAQRRDNARFRLAGETAGLATDGLKARVGAAVTATGGELRSVEDVAATPGMIRVRADARLTTGQLTALLAGLQSGEPLLVVELLTVGTGQIAGAGHANPMDIRLEVSGSFPAPAPR